MGYDFNANDIFEMAEQIEENGMLFYKNASASINNQDHKAFLIELAEMEKEHKKVFSIMKAKLIESNKVNTVFDPEDETLSYLKSLADIRVFFEKEIDLSSMKSILKAAIIAEKDSIVFYLGMKSLVPKSLGQSKLDDIIKEEMSHIKILSNRLKSL